LLLLSATSPALAQICAPPPQAVRDLDVPRYYSDAAHSVIDPTLKAAHDVAARPLHDYLEEVSRDADRYFARNDIASGECGLKWLKAWADGKAMLGHMANPQADYERKWELAGLALAYLKLKPLSSETERHSIEPWFLQLAEGVKAFFNNPEHARNNHYYWAGLAVGAVGLAAHSERDWKYAQSVYREAVAAIQPDGTLPLELARAGRALDYHNFALSPLVILAELAAVRADGDWYAQRDGALHRLVAKTIAGIRNPRLFEDLTGVRQDVPSGGQLAWIELYRHRFPDKNVGNVLEQGRQYVSPRLGGDLTTLANNLSKLDLH
jgi:poly(beta-D-mannuronate) lyase